MVVACHTLFGNVNAAIVVLYIFVLIVLSLLYRLDVSFLILMMLMVIRNTLSGFIVFELFFVIVLAALFLSSSTYERSGAIIYLGYFSLVVGCGLVTIFDMHVLSCMVLLVILAKLPLVGLHM